MATKRKPSKSRPSTLACKRRGRALAKKRTAAAGKSLAACRRPAKRASVRNPDFDSVSLDGNMAPRTVERLKKLLDERLDADYPIEGHYGSEEQRVMSRRRIEPSGDGSYGRLRYSISKRRMMTLLPSLLRSRYEDEQSLGSAIASTLDIEIV